MKILFITSFNIFPPYWGGGQRTYHLIEYLAKNHKIYLISPSYSQFKNKSGKLWQKRLKKLGAEIFLMGNWLKLQIIEFLNPFFFLKILQIIFSKKIDLIICDYPWVGAYAIFTHFLSFKPYIFLEHNIEYEIKQQTKSRYVKLMKLLEIFLSKFAKKVIVVSEKDKSKLVKLGINKRKIVVIENGFDSKRFYPNAKFNKVIRKKLGIENEPLIFFCGKFDYAPNIEALYVIRWKILPKVLEKIPNAKFVIVGGGTNDLGPELNHPSIVFTGVVDNIERYLNASDVVIVPVTKGSGTRIKILEAIACGKTVISTKKGTEGLINKLTRPFLKITDDWNLFSNYIVDSLNFKNKEVPEKFIKMYSWEKSCEKIDRILSCLHEKKK